MSNLVALLDGDSWVYRCGFAAEKTFYLAEWEGHYTKWESYREAKAEVPQGVLWSRKEVEPIENCLQMVKSSLENTLSVLGTSEYQLFLSGRGNFREEVWRDYKANRETASKPKYYRDIREYLLANWNATLVDGIEADDAVGHTSTELGNACVIVAVDKDLHQLPGDHYNWTTGERYGVTAKEGLRFFYEQLLSGDPTDNVPGIPKIGPVKAKKALAECKNPRECADTVLAMYTEAGLTLGDLDRNATLLWIQRAKDQKHPFWKHLEMAT